MSTTARALALAAALAPGAAAQAASGVAGEVVVVTAGRWDDAPETVARSVAIVSGPELGGLDGAEDAARRMAGLQPAVANGSQIAFQIRGLGAVDHQALTPGAAAVYVDGVYLATNVQTSLLAYDLERIEVLKGPQGALYGRNASSGAIHFISRGPGEAAEVEAGLALGRFGRIDADIAASGALAPGLSGRIAARYLTEDAALENVGGPEAAGGERDEFGVRGALEFEASDDLTLLARAHYEEDNGVNPAPRNSALTLGDHQISVGADGVQPTDNEFFGASLETTSKLGRWDVVWLTAVEGYNQQYGFDFDGGPAPAANLSYDRDYLQLSQETYARSRWAWGRLLIGASAAYDDFAQTYLIWCGQLDPATLVGSCTYVGAPPRVGPSPASPTPAVSLLTRISQDRTGAAAYAVGDIDLGERTVLTVGARYTTETLTGRGYGLHVYRDGTRALNNRGGLGLAIGENEIEDDRLLLNAAIRHDLGDRLAVYASYDTGYKSGGFNGEIQNNATHWQDAGLFRPETVEAIEAGLKWRPYAGAFLDAAVFHQAYDDPQARIFVAFPTPSGVITSNSLANLDAAEALGAELSAGVSVGGWDVSAGLVLLDTEIDQGASQSALNAAAFDGNPMPFASKASGVLSVRREWTLPGERRLAAELFGKAESAYYLDAEGRADRRQAGYGTADAALRLFLDRQGVELALWGRNLTNSDHAVSGYGFIGYNTFRSAPLSYGVSARVRR